MNNSIARFSGIAMLCGQLTLATGAFAGSADASDRSVSLTVCTNTGLEEDNIRERLNDLSTIVDARLTPEVMHHINKYLRYKQGLGQIIGRQMAFFPIFEDVLVKNDLPTDLKYLTVIESAIKPTATSRVGAAGLWQLMRGTGRMLGLKINRVVDERRNPYKSTEAATTYLKMLHEEFDDWTLALAAYNSGPGRVRGAIRKSGSRDYWKLRRFLPKETRDYVPAYIAATYLSNYYYHHDVTPVVEHSDFMSVSNISVYQKISFKEIADITGTTVETIKTLNPCYLKGYVPGSELGHYVLLPNYAATLLLHHFHTPDMNLEYIVPAELDNTLVQHIQEHGLRERLSNLDYLPVALSKGAINAVSEEPRTQLLNAAIIEEKPVWYRMRKRESLRDISVKYDIPLTRLIQLNADNGDLRTGSLIRIN